MRRFFFCKGDGRFRRISGPDLALRTCSGWATGPARLLAGGRHGGVERKGPFLGRPLDLRFERKFADGRCPDSKRARARRLRGQRVVGREGTRRDGRMRCGPCGATRTGSVRPEREWVRNEGERMTRTIILDMCPVPSWYIQPIARLFTRILRSFAPSLVRRY